MASQYLIWLDYVKTDLSTLWLLLWFKTIVDVIHYLPITSIIDKNNILLQSPPLNWITDNRISHFLESDISCPFLPKYYTKRVG